MTDLRRIARDYFDAGIARLGTDAARLAFTRATEADPGMGDAWLGRLAAGDQSGETLFGLYSARNSIGDQQRRVGAPTGYLCGRAPTGLYIDYPVADRVQAALAYAASLLTGNDVDGAREVLESLPQVPDAESPILDFCWAALHLRAREWPHVLSTLAGIDRWDDQYLATAATLLAGTACVQLGLFDEGLRRLEVVRTGPLTNARAQAAFTIGMALRERGDEPAACTRFQEAFALDPELSEASRALADPTYRLVIDAVDATPDEASDSLIDTDYDPLDELTRELAAQVGLTAVKEQVARLRSTATLAKVRAARGLRTGERSLHLAFTGPPGTGKTTIARIVAKLYRALGLLATDRVVEVSRRDLVGEYLGSTAPKTGAVLDSALDGVLFIDEAYSLVQEGLTGGDAFGREALDLLLARMETDRDRLVVIIAGYDTEIDRLLAANEGLASRFSRRISFPSYSPDELTQIAEVMADRRDARLSPEATATLSAAFAAMYDDLTLTLSGPRRATDLAGNGRFVRNLIESAEEEREHRLAAHADLDALTEADLMTIDAADVRRSLITVANPATGRGLP